ncbi:asparagine synthase (glutamine-hydrolyzing) [Coprobacter secundus]|uniref:asparagine synthase (glutamine-hydrolyzing) n=1 Tax=Coprobacter secundus subsp. similis TaxID=2751153 RepID=A0A7G1HVJ6_9BACT|nr:asparagine synthase (glutamine-hydrolyzing) [Coprobacter secundus]BCI63719.1 asparagine synthetase B [Coprobacter secundus subsp. similis]
MCGIAGIAGEVEQMEPLLNKMIKAQQHRGPDTVSFWISSFVDAQIGLAHNRLKITDLSDDSNQPFIDEETGLITLLDGNIFNYKELRNYLCHYYTFQTNSMIEVLSKAWHRWGKTMLNKINGNFVIAIYDQSARHIFIARDRIGIKPLYFSLQKGNFYFASEIKALFAAGVNRQMSSTRWAEYFVYSSHGMPYETFWDNIYQLPAGSSLLFNGFTLNICKWYELDKAIKEIEVPQDEKKFIERFQEITNDSIRNNIAADVPIGMNLSGSINSALLLGLIHKNAPYLPIKAFSYYNENKLSNEILWTTEMLSHTHYKHEQIKITSKIIRKEAYFIAKIQDEPFDELNTLAYTHLFRIAKNRGTTVLCDGTGLDETWGSYPIIKTNPYYGNKTPLCLKDEFIKLAKTPEYPKPFQNKIDNTKYKDLFYEKIPHILRLNDRISMAFSTELRKPFLDHRLIELFFITPEKIKIKPSTNKWIVHHNAKGLMPTSTRLIPKELINDTHQNRWFTNELKDWIDETVYNLRTGTVSHWVKGESLEKEWQRYKNGASYDPCRILKWINLHMILNQQTI